MVSGIPCRPLPTRGGPLHRPEQGGVSRERDVLGNLTEVRGLGGAQLKAAPRMIEWCEPWRMG